MKKIALTTAQLRSLCDEAEALKFANGPNGAFWKDVDPDGVHVVDLWMEHRPFLVQWAGINHGFNFQHHGGLNIRAMIVARMKRNRSGSGRKVYLKCDFDYDSFMAFVRDGSPAQGEKVTARRSAWLRVPGRFLGGGDERLGEFWPGPEPPGPGREAGKTWLRRR